MEEGPHLRLADNFQVDFHFQLSEKWWLNIYFERETVARAVGWKGASLDGKKV